MILINFINRISKSRLIATLLGIAFMYGFTSFVPNHRGPKLAELGVLKVVLDAGHGGHDPGNLGTGRYKSTEKDISLEVALQVGDYIGRAFENVDVIYTRKEDKFVKLKDRTTIANKAQADLFVSIHCNSAANKEAFGTETFVMSMTKISANLELAKRENSVILLEDNYEQTYEGFDPKEPESLIARSIAQSVYLDQSLVLSAHMQDQYRERVSRRDRGVKQAPYWVISFTTMPSVLTELGFLTNKGEEDFLNSDNGKIYMASAIYRAFKQYKAGVEGVEISTPDFESEIPDVSDEPVPTAIIHNEQEKPQKGEEKAAAAVAKSDPVTYRIQLMASGNEIELTPGNFNGLEGVKRYDVDGLKKYTVGEVTDYKKAVSLQRTVREKAFPKAFITAFYRGERISIAKALEMSRALNSEKIN
ncbi:MAG: N-acetylmuramoyl-L-alanine amidase [Flavobacteriales bacterium]|jgi:N-acetylmuramoyl-L-alanine amidase|nr:N-acetylmuramoyl-L-alanine amidase [Flavobacteriales bacterium]NCG28883.1 N-acetylmuramoyl-L-alanine amidase [Bacteroidota bacterium]MBT4704529.1 N-acetylmuramoyl-L-alanine amidase [Flavobacteriales bacterium]MBT4931284.1 N-acetylmuramoyl-L-alanine amidase [Flavobacteriales bacterium]MBT5131887.1 N-acetylmuramoyl-L-alanine amidase [Flavobacteriales bacterium]